MHNFPSFEEYSLQESYKPGTYVKLTDSGKQAMRLIMRSLETGTGAEAPVDLPDYVFLVRSSTSTEVVLSPMTNLGARFHMRPDQVAEATPALVGEAVKAPK